MQANEKRGRGRPITRPGDRRIEAYFSDAEFTAIKAAAIRAGVPVSHFIRAAVLREVITDGRL